MRRYVALLLAILITGMVGNPMALPRPVVNAIRLHAARRQAGERSRIVPRRVHEGEAGAVMRSA